LIKENTQGQAITIIVSDNNPIARLSISWFNMRLSI